MIFWLFALLLLFAHGLWSLFDPPPKAQDFDKTIGEVIGQVFRAGKNIRWFTYVTEGANVEAILLSVF